MHSVVAVPKKITQKVERVVDVPITVEKEPVVNTPKGLIPLSKWTIPTHLTEEDIEAYSMNSGKFQDQFTSQ